jgi:hypothetical protein
MKNAKAFLSFYICFQRWYLRSIILQQYMQESIVKKKQSKIFCVMKNLAINYLQSHLKQIGELSGNFFNDYDMGNGNLSV